MNIIKLKDDKIISETIKITHLIDYNNTTLVFYSGITKNGYTERWSKIDNGKFTIKRAIIIIQKFWRKILAQRQLQRLKIKSELEYFPNIGIKYFDTKYNFDQLHYETI